MALEKHLVNRITKYALITNVIAAPERLETLPVSVALRPGALTRLSHQPQVLTLRHLSLSYVWFS